MLLDGFIYGTGHQNSKLFCLELATGKVAWSTGEVTQGDVIYDEGMLYIYEGPKKGVVDLVKADSTKFELAGRFQVPAGIDKHWAHPSIANGKLYVRFNGVLYAYTLAAM